MFEGSGLSVFRIDVWMLTYTCNAADLYNQAVTVNMK